MDDKKIVKESGLPFCEVCTGPDFGARGLRGKDQGKSEFLDIAKHSCRRYGYSTIMLAVHRVPLCISVREASQ